MERELLTLPEHLSAPPVFNGVRVIPSLVLYVCFVDRCLSFWIFSFGHCGVCSFSIYGFWVLLNSYYEYKGFNRWCLVIYMCALLFIYFNRNHKVINNPGNRTENASSVINVHCHLMHRNIENGSWWVW